MLFLPAAALCCLCSALVTMAAQLFQDDPELTKRVGESVSIDCDGTNQCTSLSRVNWYQKKETGTFKDFQTASTLNIKNVGLEHSAIYYCYCWVSHAGGNTWSHLIFGSGTKLSVTDGNQKRTTQAPRVHANTQQSPTRPAGPRVHVDVNSSLLCVPPAMFPPLVQLSCKRQEKNGGEPEELPPAEGKQLELIHEQENSTYKCNCYIKDVSNSTVEAQTQQEVPAPAASCPPEREPADLPALQPADLSFQSQCRVKLLCLLYTVLIVKSLVYCCGLSLLMILTNKGASTNCTHAD